MHSVAIGKLRHRRLRESAANEPRLKKQQTPSPQQQQLMSAERNSPSQQQQSSQQQNPSSQQQHHISIHNDNNKQTLSGLTEPNPFAFMKLSKTPATIKTKQNRRATTHNR